MKWFWRCNRLMDLKCHLKSVIDQVRWLFLTARVQSVLVNMRPFPSLSERCVTAVACSGPPCRSVVTMMHEAVLGTLGLWTGTEEKHGCERLWKNDGEQRAFVSKSKTFHFMWKPFCVTRSHGIYITYTCRMKMHIRLHPAGPPNYLKPAVRE